MYKFFLSMIIASTATAATLRTTDFQQSMNAHAPRNYVKNSGAEKNDLDVTDADAIVSRTTSTPLEGDGSFSIDADASGEKAIFTASDLQSGLMGLTCEATFTYSGDASLYKAYVQLASTKVSAEQTLLNVTNSQPVSLIFPCGTSTTDDPSVVIEATSASAAAIKVDSVYLGRSVSVGTIAQSKPRFYGVRATSAQAIGSTAVTIVAINLDSGGARFDYYDELDTSTGTATMKDSGVLNVHGAAQLSSAAAENFILYVYRNGTAVCSDNSGTYNSTTIQVNCLVPVAVGDTIDIRISSSADTSYNVDNGIMTHFQASLLPGPSQIVQAMNPTNVMVTAGGTPTGALDGSATTVWGTEIRDIPGWYASGVFTAYAPGDYCWDAAALVGGTEAADNSITLSPYVNGSVLTAGVGLTRIAATGLTSSQAVSTYCTFLNVGDLLTFRTSTNITGAAFVAGSGNYLAIWNESAAGAKVYIPGSTYYGRSSVVKKGFTQLNCDSGSAITSNPDAMVASIGNVSSGACTVTLNTGYFTALDGCVLVRQSSTATSEAILRANVASVTSVVIGCKNDANADCTTYDVYMECTGS